MAERRNIHHAPARPKLVAVIGGRSRRPAPSPAPVPSASAGRVRRPRPVAAAGPRR